jgi:hypothetical protein
MALSSRGEATRGLALSPCDKERRHKETSASGGSGFREKHLKRPASEPGEKPGTIRDIIHCKQQRQSSELPVVGP